MTDSNFSAVRRIAETMKGTAVHAATGGVVAAVASVVVFRAQSLRMLCIGAGIGFRAGREWKTVSKDLESAPLPPAVVSARNAISGAIPERVSVGATSMWHQLRDRAKSASGTERKPAGDEADPGAGNGADSDRGEDPE